MITYPPWLSRYRGIPFRPHGRTPSGLDCWGLVWLIYAREYRIELPSFGNSYAGTTDPAIPRLMDSESQNEPWTPVEVEAIRLGDVLLFRRGPLPNHVGFALNSEEMIHTEHRHGVLRERFRGPIWERRLYGAFRHRAFPG